MKSLTTILAVALAVGFATPSFAAKGSMQKKSEKSAAIGKLASDFPRNRMQCKKVSGSWSDQTNTCNEKGKM
jgi:hypothetical protein